MSIFFWILVKTLFIFAIALFSASVLLKSLYFLRRLSLTGFFMSAVPVIRKYQRVEHVQVADMKKALHSDLYDGIVFNYYNNNLINKSKKDIFTFLIFFQTHCV
jgi:hypothetical protein